MQSRARVVWRARVPLIYSHIYHGVHVKSKVKRERLHSRVYEVRVLSTPLLLRDHLNKKKTASERFSVVVNVV